MNTLGYVGSAFVAFGSVAWTITSVTKCFDRGFDLYSNLPAPANDDRAHPEVRSRRASGIGSAMSMLLRQGLPDLPVRLRGMSASRASSLDLAACHCYDKCCICGQQLGQYKAFVLRPTSALSRVCVTPPAHQDCAKYRAADLSGRAGGGVMMVWVTRSCEALPGDDVIQLRIGDAEQVFWYRDNRCATRDEVRTAFEDSLPALYEVAHQSGEQAVLELDTMVARATRFFPKHAAAASTR